ncbi:MAG: hypothetical protein JWM21_3829 [Acidobacteria bacterium]|nr:hypothetical protein [Acidobacteriota bacterium]
MSRSEEIRLLPISLVAIVASAVTVAIVPFVTHLVATMAAIPVAMLSIVGMTVTLPGLF